MLDIVSADMIRIEARGVQATVIECCLREGTRLLGSICDSVYISRDPIYQI
jgi:hypothetical protein